MAQRIRVPFADTVLVRVPDQVTDDQALLVGDILSTGMTGVEHALTVRGGVLVVIGCGPVGLSAVHTARLFAPAAIIAVDRMPNRLEMAKTLGATHVCNAASEDLASIVDEVSGGRGADGVVEAVGSPATINQAVSTAGVGGRISIIGITPGNVELPLPQMLFKNLNLWTGLGDLRHMETIMAMIANGTLDPSPMITHRASLEDLPEAFARFADPGSGVIKYSITPS